MKYVKIVLIINIMHHSKLMLSGGRGNLKEINDPEGGFLYVGKMSKYMKGMSGCGGFVRRITVMNKGF